MKTVIFFMSGTGSNVEKILERVYLKYKDNVIFSIFTDNKKSNAKKIAKKYDIYYQCVDLKSFYKKKGLKSTSLLQENGFQIRSEWTKKVWQGMEQFKPDLGVFAGFETLCNICLKFRCINIHPGDLTIEENGQRILVGLGKDPVKRAMNLGHETMRSTVIEVNPIYNFTDMDNGKIIGISKPVPMLTNKDHINSIRDNKTVFDKIAELNLSVLKEKGDWLIFPKIVDQEIEKIL